MTNILIQIGIVYIHEIHICSVYSRNKKVSGNSYMYPTINLEQGYWKNSSIIKA